jgi:hypothetical protein
MVIWTITSLLSACAGAPADKIDTVSHLVEKVDALTQDAIRQKDIEKVRDVWSQISELSVSLGDHGYDDEAEAVEQLAATYMYLIDYMQTGQAESFIQFETGYSAALSYLKEAADGYDSVRRLD